MALQKSVTDDFGATHTASYTRIRSVILRTVNVSIETMSYHNAAARSKADAVAEKPPFRTDVLDVSESDFTTFFAETVLDDVDKTPFTQAYAYLKTQSTPINFTTGTSDV